MLQATGLSLSGLGAEVSPSGDVSVPTWCSVVPFSSSWFDSCKAPTAADTTQAAAEFTACQQYVAKDYPVTTTLLGPQRACHFLTGDYNVPIGLGVIGLGLILVLTLRS